MLWVHAIFIFPKKFLLKQGLLFRYPLLLLHRNHLFVCSVSNTIFCNPLTLNSVFFFLIILCLFRHTPTCMCVFVCVSVLCVHGVCSVGTFLPLNVFWSMDHIWEYLFAFHCGSQKRWKSGIQIGDFVFDIRFSLFCMTVSWDVPFTVVSQILFCPYTL